MTRKEWDMPKKVMVSEEQWDKLRIEYISDADVSMRGLQKKYGIPYNAIRNRCEAENWMSQREEVRSQTTQKSIDLVSSFQADECSRAFRIANKLMDKIEESIEALEATDAYIFKNIKSLTSAIKDLKEIGVFRSEMDKMEQMARIKKLQKETEEEVKDTKIVVTFDTDDDEYGE
jgi:transcriptional regulator of heat shock response